MTASATRGEIAVTLEGAELVLTPSFQAIDEIETQTGQTLRELVAAAERGRMSLRTVGIVLAACVRASARAGKAKEHYAQVKAESMASLAYAEDGGVLLVIRHHLVPLLMVALTGGYTAQGFRKPQTGQSSPPTSDPA